MHACDKFEIRRKTTQLIAFSKNGTLHENLLTAVL